MNASIIEDVLSLLLNIMNEVKTKVETFLKRGGDLNMWDLFRKVSTISDIIVLPFLEHLRKIISVPYLKVAISGGKDGIPSKPYISRKSGMSGSSPAEIGCLNTILS